MYLQYNHLYVKVLMKVTFTGMMKMVVTVTQSMVSYPTGHIILTQISTSAAGKR